MKLGIITRMDRTGLGNQTRNLTYMLKPSKVMVIDSTPFNKNEQHPEWYEAFNAYRVVGSPTFPQCKAFLRGIDVLLTCETFYNPQFVALANRMGVKTVLQYNWEFLDYLQHPDWPQAHTLVSPSTWHLEDAKKQFRRVFYVPPPLLPAFSDVLEYNRSRTHGKLLHIVGRPAVADRNGTQDLLRAMRYVRPDARLVIKSQVPLNLDVTDSRVQFMVDNTPDEADLYKGYDALILPRRFGGLCLPMNEALYAGLPVLMPDISPNDSVLPQSWRYKAHTEHTLYTRTNIDVHESDPQDMARVINDLLGKDLGVEKLNAFTIGHDNFSIGNVKDKWMEVLTA